MVVPIGKVFHFLGKILGFIAVKYIFVIYIYSIRFFYTGFLSVRYKSIGKGSIILPVMRLGIGLEYVQIGENVIIGTQSVITAWRFRNGTYYTPEIVIGNNCQLGDYIHLSAINSIFIGNNVLIGRFVTILDNAHGKSEKEEMNLNPALRSLYSKGKVRIEDNVWIGDKVTILSGVTIGKGAIIGANSVVTHDIPSNSIIGGIPAKIIKQF